MRVGLVDVDNRNFPNLALMKLSAWHKQQGDDVEWYAPLISGHKDRVYMSKIFTASDEFEFFIDSDEVIKGGSGYAIKIQDGREVYDNALDPELPPEIEHIYPDYSIYPTEAAFGHLTRGCPRNCGFCHTSKKDGRKSVKVADLDEFWRGQKKIYLYDQNIIACRDWKDLFQQLIDSKAKVEFSGGFDFRSMTPEQAEMIKKIKQPIIHGAWDNYEDRDVIIPKLKMFKEITNINIKRTAIYVLCNYNTTLEQDLERIYTIRELGYLPYVMLYDKEHIPRGHTYKKLQRWVNNRFVFGKCQWFEDYAG